MSLDQVAALLRPDAPNSFVADGPFRGIHGPAYSPANKGGAAAAVTCLPVHVRRPGDETWPVQSIVPVWEPTLFDTDHDLFMRIDGIRKLVRTLLFVVFRLDQIISDPTTLYRAVANRRFSGTLAFVASRADTLRALVNVTEVVGGGTPSVDLFHSALLLSLKEHDNLVHRIIRARALYEKGLLGHFPFTRLEFDNCPRVRISNVIPLLHMLMDQEKKKPVGPMEVRALTNSNKAEAEDVALQKDAQCKTPKRLLDIEPIEAPHDDTVYSLDLSAAVDKMLLPSRDLYSGRLESLTSAPTLH